MERTFQVGAFERIEVAGPYEVEVRTGGQPGRARKLSKSGSGKVNCS